MSYAKYKAKIKKMINSEDESGIGEVMSSLSPNDRVRMRKFINMSRFNKRKKEKRAYAKYKSERSRARKSIAQKTGRALYDTKKRRNQKSAKKILKGFGLA